MIKNSQPFGKKCPKTAGGFFDSHCSILSFTLHVCVQSEQTAIHVHVTLLPRDVELKFSPQGSVEILQNSELNEEISAVDCVLLYALAQSLFRL